jgi:hypothetical protein
MTLNQLAGGKHAGAVHNVAKQPMLLKCKGVQIGRNSLTYLDSRSGVNVIHQRLQRGHRVTISVPGPCP